MKVSIQTLGSLGDVMPFITTAKQLEKLGATVSILAPRDYTTVIRGHGIHASEPPDFSLDLWNREAEQRGTLSGPLNFLRDWPDMVEPYVADIMEQSLHAAEGADVILANGICAPARLAAEHYKIPYLLHALQPVISPTSETPCAMVWRPWQGQILNKYGYGVVWIAQTFMERALRPHRKRLHLEDMPSFNQTRTHLNQPLPRISSISPCLMDQKPADWAENDFLLAYPSLEELPLDALPEDLRAFSAAGPPPVFVSLGSLEGETPIRLIDTIFSALEHLGLRAIVSDALASKLSSGRLAAHFVVGHVSHPPLFKLCSAIIHHGGAGVMH
ncbi:MAG: hypothetical protein R3C04_08765 [Hyphomonas sp.]